LDAAILCGAMLEASFYAVRQQPGRQRIFVRTPMAKRLFIVCDITNPFAAPI
jgi:hypothetical protein